MDEDGTAPADRPVDEAPRPVERWRPRPVRGLDELLDDLLGAPVARRSRPGLRFSESRVGS